MTIQEIKELISEEFRGNINLDAIKFKNISNCILEISVEKDIQKNISILNENLQTQIKEFTDELIIQKEKVENLENQNKVNENLIIEKDEIIRKFDELTKIKLEIEELQKKQEELFKKENDINVLNANLKNINVENDEIINEYLIKINEINLKLNDSTNVLENQLRVSIENANENISKIQNIHSGTLEKLSSLPLTTLFEKINSDIDRLTNDYNEHVEKLNSIRIDLEKIEEKHKSVIETFIKHRLENEAIYGALKDRSEFDGVNNYVENLNKEITEKLKEFDKQILSVIKNRENLHIYELEQKKESQ